MKALIRITLLFAAIVLAGMSVAQAQRVISGTVYKDGELAAGITVEVHKGGSMMTGFDGKYELPANEKSKWIKFTFIDESKKLDIEGKTGNVFDFAFSGEIPSGDGEDEGASGEVNLSPADKLIKEQNEDFMNEFSMYREFYKQDDYKSAMPHWKHLVNTYPKSTENLYIQGAKMYESMLENAKTDAEIDKLLGAYMKMYDARIKYFGDEGNVLGRKGTAWLKYKLNADNDNPPSGEELKKIHKAGYEYLSKSVELRGNETEPPVLILLMQTTVALFKFGELPQEQVVKNYEETTQIANAIIAESDDANTVKVTKETVLPYIEEIFAKSGAADCDVLVKIFSKEYEENSDDIDYVKTMLRKLSRANCTESELFANATEKLYELDPSAEAAYNMARRSIKSGDIAKAKEYYKMAMEQETDQELLATYYLQYAKVLYSESAYSDARSYARKVLDIQSDNCEANMLIGNIYVSASQKFQGTKLEKSAIFWLACDYFAKARRGDDCSIEASENLSKYRKYFPNKEEAFMEGLQEGSTYRVEGWINESTKVRF